MLYANPHDSFFQYSRKGLDGDACRLIINKLNDDVCARFLGNPSIGYAFSETTAAHVVRTYQTMEKTLLSVLPNDAKTREMLERRKAMITVHDTSDIIREMIVASTETDPVQKEKCAAALDAYDLAVTPFAYKLALFATAENDESIFNGVIDTIRDKTIPHDQNGRGLSIEEAVAFSKQSVTLVQGYNTEFSRYPFWNEGRTGEKVARMMGFYHAIEQTLDFDGLQSQIHEKCDGTAYALDVHAAKSAQNMTPNLRHNPMHLQPRINGRFEKNLFKLYQEAGNNEAKLLSAVATINYCYGISKQTFRTGKKFVTLQPFSGEPVELDDPQAHEDFDAALENLYRDNFMPELIPSDKAIGVYDEAMHNMLHNGRLLLPEPNKTLVHAMLSNDSYAVTIDLPHKLRDSLAKLAV